MQLKDINELLEKMTLDEKIGQLHQMGPTMSSTLAGYEVDINELVTMMLEGNLSREAFEEKIALMEESLHEEDIRRGRLGNFIGLYDREKINKVQKIAVEKSRLGIPLFIGVDVVRGYKTIFPTPLAQACSWDMELIQKIASAGAAEAAADGVNWTFGPMLDIARDARWGRIVESPGEDPLLAGEIARAMIAGFQGSDFSESGKVMACAKHFAAYGAASGGQDYNTVDMSLPMLYDIYLPPFQAAVDAGVGSVMSAFNDLNGIPCTLNRWLLQEVLREQMGFDGLVVSDAEGVRQCVPHGACVDEADAARQSLLAGGDMDMSSGAYSAFLKGLVQEGKLSEEDIDQAVRRVLKMKVRAGLFKRPTEHSEEAAEKIQLCPSHLALSREAAQKTAVLLKNEGVLPLNIKGGRLAVIGELADSKEAVLGPWSFTGDQEKAVTILEAVRHYEAAEDITVTYARGCGVVGNSTDDFEAALKVAGEAEAVIIVAGESAFMSGEAASKADLGLPGVQMDLIRRLNTLGKPVIVLLVNGRPLDIGWLKEHVAAIIDIWHCGTWGACGIADILFGKANPSGKLTVTFANSAGQEPMYYNHPNTGKPGGSFKFTSKYQDVPIEPLYPFGYGLSYTSYEYENLQLNKTSLHPDEQLTVSVDITNTGAMAGEEIVQLYIQDVTASRVRPVKELKAFTKLMLQPGEKKTAILTIKAVDLGFHTPDLKYIVEPGIFRLWAGENSISGLETSFEVV